MRHVCFAIFFNLWRGGISETQSEELDVLVLGAGIAGIKAAATLHAAGVERFMVLEQSHRIGGRMWNMAWQGMEIELGANWIEGIPQDINPIWKIAQKIDLKGNYTNQEGDRIEPVLWGENGPMPKDEASVLHSRLTAVIENATRLNCYRRQHNLDDISLREGFLKAGWPAPEKQTPMERTLEFFVVDWDFEYPPENVSMFNYFGSCDSTDNSTSRPRAKTAISLGLFGAQYPWRPPRYFVTDPRGYAAVVEFIARPFLNSTQPRIMFNEAVISVAYSSEGVEVRTTNGKLYRSRYAISTFSAGVVNHAIRAKSLFYPELPQWKTNAYAMVDDGIYTKIFLRYEYKFWKDADYVLYAHPEKRGYYAVWQDMESHGKFFPEHANILMTTVVNADSRRVETQSRNATIVEIQTVLYHMYGRHIPDPVDIYVPAWGDNPYFRGCFSSMKPGITRKDFALAQKAVGGLHFAGESTDFEYNGFVTGGYRSGEHVALRVIERLHSQYSDIIV